MALLESKIKVRQETLQLYDLVAQEKSVLDPERMVIIQEKKSFKETLNVIYAILVNFSAPIDNKLNALLLLKKLFQTAHPDIIKQAVRILPVLADIVTSAIKEIVPGTLYFVLKELRPVDEVDRGRKYVRFAMEILKQWSQYMVDVNESSSVYVSVFCQLQSQEAGFPPYFLYFTMRDYVQFMLNWMKRKKKDQAFKDKVEIYYFLTDQSYYSKNIMFYRNNLSQNAGLIVYEAYSILINNSIPVQIKLQCLKAVKELYQEANLIFSDKTQELILPYFDYFVDLFMNSHIPHERYFQIVERRLGVNQNQSKQYVYTILQMIKQWDKYHSNSTVNLFGKSSQKIDKKGLLNGADRFIYQPNDFNKYIDNSSIGKHRESQYVIPSPKPAATDRQKMFNQRANMYQKQLADKAKSQENFRREIQQLKQRLNQKPMVIQQIVQPVIAPMPRLQQNQDSPGQIVYNRVVSQSQIRKSALEDRQKQLMQQVAKSRNQSRQPYEKDKNSSDFKMTRNESEKKYGSTRSGGKQYFDISMIHKLSDAVKYKQLKQSKFSRY